MDKTKKLLVNYFGEYYATFGPDGVSASGKPYIQVVPDDYYELGALVQGIPYVLLDVAPNGKVRDVRRVMSISPVEG